MRSCFRAPLRRRRRSFSCPWLGCRRRGPCGGCLGPGFACAGLWRRSLAGRTLACLAALRAVRSALARALTRAGLGRVPMHARRAATTGRRGLGSVTRARRLLLANRAPVAGLAYPPRGQHAQAICHESQLARRRQAGQLKRDRCDRCQADGHGEHRVDGAALAGAANPAPSLSHRARAAQCRCPPAWRRAGGLGRGLGGHPGSPGLPASTCGGYRFSTCSAAVYPLCEASPLSQPVALRIMADAFAVMTIAPRPLLAHRWRRAWCLHGSRTGRGHRPTIAFRLRNGDRVHSFRGRRTARSKPAHPGPTPTRHHIRA